MRRNCLPWTGRGIVAAATLLALAVVCAAGPREAAPGVDPALPVGPALEPVPISEYRAVFHVAPQGSDAQGDGSRERPWGTPAGALSRVDAAGHARRAAVLIAAGTYPVRALRLKSHVDLYGGFTPDFSRRGGEGAGEAILDAGGKDRVLIGADHARVDGFTLRGGRAAAHGGGVLCDRTSPILTNNRFEHNTTLESPDYLRGVYHQVGTEGGAIACLNYAAPRIEGNLFLNNSTEIGGGGAIALRSDSVRPREEAPEPVVRRNLFLGNRTGTADDNPDVKKRFRTSNGGAISLSNYLADISQNLFIENHAGGNGDGGAIYCEYESSARIARNHFLGNHAEDDGAAIYAMKLSEPTIEANVFAGNGGGGAIRLSKQGRARIAGNLLFANVTGGIFSGDSWAVVERNVIMDNAGPGFGHQIQTASYLRPPEVRGNVIRGNAGAEIRVEGAEPAIIEGNNVRGGHAGAGNTDADPGLDTAGVSLRVAKSHFDPRAGLTTAEAVGPVPDAGRLLGRVVRSGAALGLLVHVEGRRIVAAGRLPEGSGTWEALGTYRPLSR